MRFRTTVLQFIILFGPFFGSYPTFGHSLCSGVLSKGQPSYAEQADSLLPEAAAEAIANTLKLEVESLRDERSGFAKNLPQAIFARYLELRLGDLDFAIQQEVYWVIENQLKVVATKRLNVSGSANPRRNEIKISVPESLIDTVTVYGILVHEVEHIIQNLLIGVPYAAQNLYHPRFPKYRHALEKGAMTAESVFLRAFPIEVLQQEMENLIRISQDHPARFQFLVNAHKNAIESNSIPEYLARTWQQGRYSHSEMLKAQLISYAIFPGAIPIFLFLEPYLTSLF